MAGPRPCSDARRATLGRTTAKTAHICVICAPRATIARAHPTFRQTSVVYLAHSGRPVRVVLRRALPNKSSAYLIFRAKKTGAEFTVGNQGFGRRHETVFVRFTKDGDGRRVKCPSLKVKVDPDTNQVRISFRQSCLGRHAGPIRAAGFTETTGAHGQDADITRWLHVRRG